GTDVGPPGSKDLIEQLEEALADQLRERLRDRLAEDVAATEQGQVTGVGGLEHVVGPDHHGDGGRGLLEQVVEALALAFGFGPGDLLAQELPVALLGPAAIGDVLAGA